MEEKIINIAKELFLKFGFKSVTMDDIANKLGMSKKTIYKYFDNKTKLVETCVDLLFEEVNSGVLRVCRQKQNPIEELYAIEEFVLSYIDERDEAKSHQLKRFYPELHRKLEQQWYKSLQVCKSENLKRGKKMGLYREDVDEDFVMGIYFSGLLASCNEDVFPDAEKNKSKYVFKFIEYHIRAIATKKGLEKLETIINK